MLEQIIATKKQELQTLSLPDKTNVAHLSFYKALQHPHHTPGVIAEVKQASPSKGMIKDAFEPNEIAKDYEAGGADAVSVLTDKSYFRGDRTFIQQIKQNINIPVLRKDFIIDPLQVEESDRIGADAILLIVAAMDVHKLHELYSLAEEKGLDCLVEVHSEEELDRLLSVFTPRIIGVNNRDLTTFETTIRQSERLADRIPAEALFVSESGISTYNDIQTVRSFGADCILVGEALMRAQTPQTGIQSLFGGKRHVTNSN